MTDISEQMMEDHRKMVITTGNLSIFQLNNLKMFPRVIFNDIIITRTRINYDFEESTTNEEGNVEKRIYEGKVIYDLYFDEEPFYLENDLNKRLKDLEQWVKHLFWQDTEVEILKEGKKWI